MLTRLFTLLYFGTIMTASAGIVFAEESSNAQLLRVGTIERPPFAYKEGDQWKGFSIDLWSEIAQRNNYDLEYREFSVFADMIKNTQSGSVDLSVANISITLEREEEMDFSQPIFDSGLAMMIQKHGSDEHISLRTLKDSRFYTVLGIVVLVLTIFFLRRSIFTLKVKNKVFRYQNQIALILGGFVLIGYFNYILVTIGYEQTDTKDRIVSYTDITHELVGVTIGSTSEKFVVEHNIPHRSYAVLEEIYTDLSYGEIDMIIHDLPILEYYIKSSGSDFEIIGNVFQKEKYGILMPEDSSVKEDINRTLLEIRDSDVYEDISRKYF